MPHQRHEQNHHHEQHDALDLLTAENICEKFGIAKRTLQTWRQTGRFPQPDLAIGKTKRWRRSSVAEWLDTQNNGNRRRPA